MSNDKKIVSPILKQKDNWKLFDNAHPTINKPAMVRICHNTIFMKETETEKYPLEDIKIAYYDGNKWIISPPYPKYDYSVLTTHGDIREYAKVTHWIYANKEEIDWWNNRFNYINKYKTLVLEVDKDNEEKLYRALLHGASLIERHASPDLRYLADFLYDLQTCIDFSLIDNKDKKGS